MRPETDATEAGVRGEIRVNKLTTIDIDDMYRLMSRCGGRNGRQSGSQREPTSGHITPTLERMEQ